MKNLIYKLYFLKNIFLRILKFLMKNIKKNLIMIKGFINFKIFNTFFVLLSTYNVSIKKLKINIFMINDIKNIFLYIRKS